MILGKTDDKNDVYDKLYFVRRDVTDIKIPSFITYISASTFCNCDKITSFEIDENSELSYVGSLVFSSSSIENFTIPSKLENFEYSWCEETQKLNNVNVSKHNKKFMKYENSFILSKSDLDSEIYDTLFFSPRNIEKVLIPSFIKDIFYYSFEFCNNIKSLVFEENSQLHNICEYSFFLYLHSCIS